MEHPIHQPTTNHDPRVGSCTLTSEPNLPPLGPGGVEVTVETFVGPEVPADEIVENKTVRVDAAESPPEIPGAPIACQWCTTVGHDTDSCPLTNFQQFKLKGVIESWMKKGTDRLSTTSSDDSAEDSPTPSVGSAPSPVPRAPVPSGLGSGADPSTPIPTTEQAGEKTATTPPQTTPPPPTKLQRTPDDMGVSSAERLLSSIGVRAKGKTRQTPQPGVGAAPLEGKVEKAPNKSAEETKPAEQATSKLAEATKPVEKAPSKPAEVVKLVEQAPSKQAEVTKLVRKTPSKPAEMTKPVKKISGEPTRATKPVANVAGQAKTPGRSNGKKTVEQQILQKLAKMENRPKIGTSKTEKATVKSHAVPETTTQDHKTGKWDIDDVLITYDGIKQSHSESTQPGTKRKHTDEPSPDTVNKGTG